MIDTYWSLPSNESNSTDLDNNATDPANETSGNETNGGNKTDAADQSNDTSVNKTGPDESIGGKRRLAEQAFAWRRLQNFSNSSFMNPFGEEEEKEVPLKKKGYMIEYEELPADEVCKSNATCSCSKGVVEEIDYSTGTTKKFEACECGCCYRLSQAGTNLTCPEENNT